MLSRRRLSLMVPFCAVLAVGMVGTSELAFAQSPSEIAAAKEWFAEGKKLEDQGDWAGALVLFRRAAEVKKTPQILFHQGLCEKNTGALVEAILSLSRAAEMARAQGNAQVEKSSATELEDARARVPSLRLVPPQGQTPTRVLLDGAVLSSAMLDQPMPVNPGKRVILAEFPTGQFTTTIQLAEKQSETVNLVAPATGAGAPPATGTPTTAPPATASAPSAPLAPTPPVSGQGSHGRDEGPKASARSTTVPWILVGAGAVVAGGGVVFWLKRNGEISALDDICPQRDACPAEREAEVNDTKDRGTLYSAVGLGMLGLGVASVATGGILLLGDGSSTTASASVMPVAGPRAAGATVVGRF